MTENTKIELESQKLPIIETNTELKELLNEITIKSLDSQAVSDICKEFIANGIELPKWSRGFGQTIPISSTAQMFDKLKIEYIRAKWVINQ